MNLTDVSTCVSSEYPQRVEAGEAQEGEERDSGVKTGNWEALNILNSLSCLIMIISQHGINSLVSICLPVDFSSTA